MNTLFDISEFEIKTKKEVKIEKEVKIVVSKEKPLTKAQLTFNRLSKKVGNLQTEITSGKGKLERLQKVYSAKIPALEKEIAGYQIKVAKKIAFSVSSEKYGKRQLENIGCIITDLCGQAFQFIEPDKETEALYDQWSETSFQEEKDLQEADMKQMMEDLIRQRMGVDIDMSELDDSPESFARFQEKIKNEFENLKEKDEGQAKQSKKSKKALEKEIILQEEETMMLKSLRSIYISLAKVLHPDTETDPAEKLRKEELMKKVTVAYSEKNLTALLKMEMEWVNAECHNLNAMTDAKLKLYISALKVQVDDLEEELYALYGHPRYKDISDISHYPEDIAESEIKAQVNQYMKQKKGINEIITLFSQPHPKKMIMDFVNQSIEILNRRNFWEERFF